MAVASFLVPSAGLHDIGLPADPTGLFNLLFFVYPAPLVDVATAAAKSLF